MKRLWLLLPFAVFWLTWWIYMELLPVGWWLVPCAATMWALVVASVVFAVRRSGVFND